MKYTAVVLAGSRPGVDPFARDHGTDLKPLIPIAGEAMVRRPVRALLQSSSIARVIILTQQPKRIAAALQDHAAIAVRQSAATIAATMLALIAEPALEWPLLVTTADHALLDAAMVDEFCSAAADVELAIGVVERDALMHRLPGTRRTWLRFRGGAYTGANLFALRSRAVAPAIEMWRAVEQDRKRGWRLLALLGPSVLVGAALRLLTIDDVLDRVGRRLRLTMKAVRLSSPLAGVDVDKPADHALIEAIVAGRA